MAAACCCHRALVPQQTVDGLHVALEIRSRSSYVPNITTGVRSQLIQRCAPECAVSDAGLEIPIWMK
jgi:hypothetical protein